MRVLVCGSRTLQDFIPVFTLLWGLRYRAGATLTLIEGGNRGRIEQADGTFVNSGADRFAGEWAERYLSPGRHETYPADWKRHGPRRAGPIRNQEMLRTGVDLVVAFVDKPLEQSRGTAHMVSISRAAGVEVWVVQVPDGPHD